MSQLRKSASFRSRIPIKNKIPQRRCCSPPAVVSNHYNLPVVSKPRRAKKIINRRYSSSSYSSGDESNESEAPIKKVVKPSEYCRSNWYADDTISINGILDTVSNSGSFSGPPSPNKYENIKKGDRASSSYESLDKYNIALENMNVSDGFNPTNEINKNLIFMPNKTRQFKKTQMDNTERVIQQHQEINQNNGNSLPKDYGQFKKIVNDTQGQSKYYKKQIRTKMIMQSLSLEPSHEKAISSPSILSMNGNEQQEFIKHHHNHQQQQKQEQQLYLDLNYHKNNFNNGDIVLHQTPPPYKSPEPSKRDIIIRRIEKNRNWKKKRDDNLNFEKNRATTVAAFKNNSNSSSNNNNNNNNNSNSSSGGGGGSKNNDGICDTFLSSRNNVKQENQTRNINRNKNITAKAFYQLPLLLPPSATNQNNKINNKEQYCWQHENQLHQHQQFSKYQLHKQNDTNNLAYESNNMLSYPKEQPKHINKNNENNEILSNDIFNGDNTKNIQIYYRHFDEAETKHKDLFNILTTSTATITAKSPILTRKHEKHGSFNLTNNVTQHDHCNVSGSSIIMSKYHDLVKQKEQEQNQEHQPKYKHKQQHQQHQEQKHHNHQFQFYPLKDINLKPIGQKFRQNQYQIEKTPNYINYNSSSTNDEQLNIIGIPITAIFEGNEQKETKEIEEVKEEDEIYENYRMTRNENLISDQNRAKFYCSEQCKLDANKVINEFDFEKKLKYLQARRRPLPQPPQQDEIFPPKTSTSYRSECELSGSYVSLECPSPPGPPLCLPETRRDPQTRLNNYLKTLYTDLALKEPIIPPWAIPVAPGALCPARLEPELRLHPQSHGFSDCILVDQLLLPIHTKEGNFLEAPRRVLIECPQWVSRTNLTLRILYAWAKEPPWPPKGTPIALALFIPLNELKRSFSNYVEKELLLKGPLNPFANGIGGFTAAWNSLETLGPKLLVILDGYDNQKGSPKRKGKYYPSDVYDLLDGKLFPEARVIITSSSPNCTEILPLIQRHVKYEGLTWGRSASLLGGGQWNAAPARLLDTVQECQELRRIVRTPLGCLAVAAIFEATAGDVPTDELDIIESVLNCVAPETSANNVAELGRLALFCLKMKRSCITLSELRMYCSSPESNIMGCLEKSLLLGRSSKKKGEYVYHSMCPEMMEFLAANYLASLSNRPGLLAAEITGLSIGDSELDPEMLKVIKYAMGLLGPRSHILLSKLTPLWLTPQNIFSLALAGGNSEDNLSALCDILGISKHPPISPLESKPLWVQVRSAPIELMGWGMALQSPTCTLKNLELAYQLEKHILLDSRNAMDMFLDSIDRNESVSTLRITSLIENEVKDTEINYLASCVSRAILKPRLENFELILTLLEEDPPILRLQPVVLALCRSIPRQQKLTYLQLDLGLSTSQLVQICSVLDKCPNITRLSLPHLRCERGAVSTLATLLSTRPLSFLAIPSCWGARDDPPSSSGVSMGSGSGSSTATSGLIKQGSLTGVPSPRSYPPGLFSSLPRGIYVPTATMGRSATLPRQPIEPPPDKRSCDSVISKTWYPTPACDGGPHNSGTLHELLLAAREPYSKLHGLDLTKAQLSLEDSMCLGETVRLSNTLHTLKLEGSSRLSEVLPSILGASESPCLQMLSIGSPRLNVEDSAVSMAARALTSCSTLRLLSLDGWGFRVENPSTLSIIRAFLSLTSIRELSLANCRLQIGAFKTDSKIINAFESRSVVVLKLSAAQVSLADSTILRGPQLLPYVGGFPCLRELDISAPARSGLASTTHSSPLIIDDKCLIKFFQSLHSYFSLLNTLKICNWVIHFDDSTKTLKSLSKCIRNSPISHLKLDGISVLDKIKKNRIESQFIHCFISALPLLRWMGISLSGKKEDQITAIGNAVLDLKGYEIDIKLSESTIEHAKLMAQAISLDGKFDIKVSTFGTSSGILIHAEKSGIRSLNRKHKD